MVILAHFISKAVRFHQKMTELLVDCLLEFLECAIHSVLYVRGIYPAELFERRMYLGVAVWKSRHPEINNYIHRIMKNVKPLIQKVGIRYKIYFHFLFCKWTLMKRKI